MKRNKLLRKILKARTANKRLIAKAVWLEVNKQIPRSKPKEGFGIFEGSVNAAIDHLDRNIERNRKQLESLFKEQYRRDDRACKE